MCFLAARLKLKSKFVTRGVNFQPLFQCFHDVTFQGYRQSLPGNRKKTALKTITTSLLSLLIQVHLITDYFPIIFSLEIWLDCVLSLGCVL